MPKKKKPPSQKSISETDHSKMARIQNSPSQQRREHSQLEDFSPARIRKAAPAIVQNISF
jgi:hypothetical protein